MKEDEVVAEVRRFRDEHAAKFNYDVDAIAEDLKKREGLDKCPVVCLPPKRIPFQHASG